VPATLLCSEESIKNRVSASERLMQAGLALPVRLNKDVPPKVPETQLTNSSVNNAPSLTFRSDELPIDDTHNVKTSEEEEVFHLNQNKIRELSSEETNSNSVENRVSWVTTSSLHLPSSFIAFITYVDDDANIYFQLEQSKC